MEKTGEYEKETPLAAEFRECLEATIEDCLKCVSYSNICRAFPKVEKAALKPLHRDMTLDVSSSLANVTGDFILEKGFVEKLNELWYRSKDLPITNESVWRPSGDPAKDVESHLIELKKNHLQNLSTELSCVQLESERKLEEIALLEEEIEHSHKLIHAAKRELQGKLNEEDT